MTGVSINGRNYWIEPPNGKYMYDGWEERLELSIGHNRREFEKWLDNRIRPFLVKSTEFVITESVGGGIGDCFDPFVIHLDERDIKKLGIYKIPGRKWVELVDKHGFVLYVLNISSNRITVSYMSAYGNTLYGFEVGDKLRVRDVASPKTMIDRVYFNGIHGLEV